jgi:hypothetical protein
MMDYQAQDRKPGQVTIALQELNEAIASLEDRHSIMFERLAPMRFERPAAAEDGQKRSEQPELRAPIANDIHAMVSRVRRMESMIATFTAEVEI